MAPFFSYSTLSSFSVAFNSLTGELMAYSSVWARAGEPIGSSPGVSVRDGEGGWPCRPVSASHEGAEPGDLLADDQVLHLIRAFVGVECLGIREEPRNVVVDQDAVAAQQLSRPGEGLTRLGRRERLRKRRLLVRKLAFVRKLCCASHHALAGSDVAEHLP